MKINDKLHDHATMNNQLSASLIITTYNWPEALTVTLHSVLKQSRRPEEIIVADDGSGPTTAQVAKRVLQLSGMRWCHVWHQDKGIRQARIKNLAVKHSAASYLIFIDQDVVLHPDFVVDHLAMAEKALFLQGKRCFLPEHYTSKLLNHGFVTPPSPFMRGMQNRKNAFRCPALGRILVRPRSFQKSMRGCNLSMHKEHFLKVDGYDENFDQLWGREDSDICYRLFHNGIKIKNLWFSAVQYHLHHTVIKRKEEDRLDMELRRNLQEKRRKALEGFSRLSSEGDIIAASDDF